MSSCLRRVLHPFCLRSVEPTDDRCLAGLADALWGRTRHSSAVPRAEMRGPPRGQGHDQTAGQRFRPRWIFRIRFLNSDMKPCPGLSPGPAGVALPGCRSGSPDGTPGSQRD
jgi:hypothetical protein